MLAWSSAVVMASGLMSCIVLANFLVQCLWVAMKAHAIARKAAVAVAFQKSAVTRLIAPPREIARIALLNRLR